MLLPILLRLLLLLVLVLLMILEEKIKEEEDYLRRKGLLDRYVPRTWLMPSVLT